MNKNDKAIQKSTELLDVFRQQIVKIGNGLDEEQFFHFLTHFCAILLSCSTMALFKNDISLRIRRKYIDDVMNLAEQMITEEEKQRTNKPTLN